MNKDKDERRNFKRYRKRVPAVVKAGGRSLEAEIIDYSFNGLGILFDDSPPVKNGMHLSVESDGISGTAKGNVVWLVKSSLDLRVGLFRECPIEGGLKDYRLSDILIGFQRSLLTGVLRVWRGAVEKLLYIRGGDMIFAASNRDEDRLGDVLLREGKITREDFDRSSELIRKTGRRQGGILVELGCLDAKGLIWAVTHQVEEIITGLFALSDGRFKFEEGALPTEEIVTLKLSAGDIIYKGLKRHGSSLPGDFLNLPQEAVLAFSQSPLDLFQRISFEAEDRKILSLIDGKRTLGEIIKLSEMEEGAVRASVSVLMSTHLIEVSETEQGDGITLEDISGRDEVESDFMERINDMHGKYKGLDHYSLFGVKEYAPDSEIRKKYYRLAKEFHPDMHFSIKEDMKGKLHEIFSHITYAYGVLMNSAQRKEYDKSLSGGQKASASKTEMAKNRFFDGMAEFKRKKFKEAAQFFAEASYMDDSAVKFHLYYGLSLSGLGKYKEAERALSRALRLEPQNDELLSEIGHVYIKLGFPLRAKGNFNKALAINPENQRAKEGLLSVE